MSTLLKSLSIHPGENLDTSKIQNQKNSKYILEIWCRLVEFNLTEINTSCSIFTDSILSYLKKILFYLYQIGFCEAQTQK